MAAKIRRMLSLYALYARMDFRWFTQDTFICGVCILSDLIANIASVSGILLLSIRFSGVGGMSADAVLFMLGFYTMADGLTYMFSGFNVSHISRRIGRGQVEHMLIQPMPLWMQIATEGFMPVSGNSGLLLGTLLTAVAAIRLGITITPLWLASLLGYMLLRMAIVLASNYLVGASAFYRPAACEEISSVSNDLFVTLGRFPLVGLPNWLREALLTILPVGLMAWFPAMALMGQIDAPRAWLLPICVAAVLMALSTLAFKKGLKHYAKYGISRYRDMGHRG